MKLTIPANISRTFNKVGFQLKKHSPEILVTAGVIGTVASAVIACRATTKLRAVLDTADEQIEAIHLCTERGYTVNPETREKEDYTDEDSKKELAMTYVHTGFEIAKLYAPAVILGALSITGIVASNNILRKRNIALAAAYATVDKSFKAYRSRVVERFGEELDRELRHNIKAQEIETTTTDENGNETTTKKTVMGIDPNDISEYARFFDDGNPGWCKDSEANLTFLKLQQAQLNDRLKRRGYVFLNEAYDSIGIPRTKAGQIVGWYYDEKDPTRDNFIDFGIYKSPYFVNGQERTILLDFNVDGNILNYL